MAGLYIHVPFCAKRCIYCDFYSNTDMHYKGDYVASLVREMELRRDYLQGERVGTIYFGGGTPSQLKPKDYSCLFDNIYKNFIVSDVPEVTIEANPDDLSGDYVNSLRQLPFNRISIGIQSFIDKDLTFLNRRHTAIQAIDAVKRCQDAGLNNISIDLIYGLPGQTNENWEYNLEKAIQLNVPHLSAYSLTYEKGTAIYKMYENEDIVPVEDEQCEYFFNKLVEVLTAENYVHYEISNFAKRTKEHPDGQISMHNSSYWNGTHYIGLGASAHSYNGNSRSWNISSISDYINSIKEKGEIPNEIEHLDSRMRYNDFIITHLRTMWGVSLEELKKEFGEVKKQHFLQQIESLVGLNMLNRKGDIVKISQQSVFLSDMIMRDLMDI